MSQKKKALDKTPISMCVSCKKKAEVFPTVGSSPDFKNGMCKKCFEKKRPKESQVIRLNDPLARGDVTVLHSPKQSFDKLEKVLTLHHQGKAPKHVYGHGRDGFGIYGKNVRTAKSIV